jgi:hypothetical protein
MDAHNGPDLCGLPQGKDGEVKNNDRPEDDGTIFLIDYGISKKLDNLSDPEQQQRIEQLKAMAQIAPSHVHQNTF